VAGARVVVGFGVVVRALVLVADEEADGSTERDAGLDAGLDLDGIGFVALHAVVAVSRRRARQSRGGAREW
jgi:hypothetical protein